MPKTKLTKIALAKKLGVSRSSLYYKPKKPPKDEGLRQKILVVMQEHSAYGQRRIALELGWNKKLVKRVMNKFGLHPKLKRGKKPNKPDDQNRLEIKTENILSRLRPIRPNVVWAGDFTYFYFLGCFWYLATVIDVHTREIIGWHIGNHHTTSLIIEALKDALRRTGKTPQWFHSDQGSEYVSGAYAVLLAAHEIKASFSRKSSPWQNGYQESFYSNFKLELGNISRFRELGEFIEAVHGQINYYNSKRIHTSLRMPPLVFRKRYEQKRAALATV
jgi:transposase InsO family protein